MGSVVYKLAEDVSTDIIYPGRFMATVLPSETPQFCFADDAEFNQSLVSGKVEPGSVIVAEENFGSGSSREQAASTLKGHGLIVVAKSFARIFLQNAVNLGLETVTCPDIEANVGDLLEIGKESVLNRTTGKRFSVKPLPATKQEVVDAGGLIPYVRKRVIAERGA